MTEETMKIQNKLGLHARAAALFTQQATGFSSSIEVIKDHVKVNGKSIMELLTLAAAKGCLITVRAEGSDEKAAILALRELVDRKFGEGE